MIIDTPDGPKFEWEVDEETLRAAQAATAEAATKSKAKQEAREFAKREAAEKERLAAENQRAAHERERLEKQRAEAEADAAAKVVVAEWQPAANAPALVTLAKHGDAGVLQAWLEAGCDPDVLVPEHKGSDDCIHCDDWTPLAAAAASGKQSVVSLLLKYGADPNFVCCSSSFDGPTRFYTALDCARTGEALPFVLIVDGREVPSGSDEERRLACAKHPPAEQVVLQAGGKPAAVLPAPRMSARGRACTRGQRQNPCLDKDGAPLRRAPAAADSRPLPPPPPPPASPHGPSAAAFAGDDRELQSALEDIEERLGACGTGYVERKRLMRGLLLEWHPDKRPDKSELATRVFQWLQEVKWEDPAS